MVQLNFDSRNVDPSSPFDPIPAGWYEAEIINSEMKPTKNRNGSYLELTIKILGPTHAGRQIWDRLNLDNPNETAVEIAQRSLSAICRATGVLSVSDSAELHGKPLAVKVKVRAETAEFDATNEIKDYKALDEQATTGGNNAGAPAAASGGGGGGAPPWARS